MSGPWPDVVEVFVVRNLQVAARPSLVPTEATALDRVTRAISVVTASAEGIPHAATIDSFTAVSGEPSLVMVSLTQGSTMLDFIERAGSFAVSVLAFDQEALARRFASRNRGLGFAQFEEVDISTGPWTKAPLLHGCLAWFECELHSLVAAGDHQLVIGSLLEGSVGQNKPALLRQNRAYQRASG
jgi:flavin reductase (DIM6/NTAB) family NADH-FMN oxidoreductase RutF